MNNPENPDKLLYLSWVRCGFHIFLYCTHTVTLVGLCAHSVWFPWHVFGLCHFVTRALQKSTQQMWPEWNSGVRTARQLKERVRSSDVICFSEIKDSSRALLHKLMRAFLRLLCSLERDYTGFNTDLPLFLCKTTQLPLWQDRGSGGGACPIVGGLWQVCEIGSKCDKLWSSA